MDKFVTAVGVTILTGGVLFVAALLGTALGWLIGWTVGLFFSDTILAFLAAFGIKGLSMAQVGASFGFIGSFFRSTTSCNKD